jgi:oligopeptidase B
VRQDDYHWLSNREDPEVRDYLDLENAYTVSATDHLESLRSALYNEMERRLPGADTTAPVSFQGWNYYTRTEEGKSYSIHARKKVPIRNRRASPEVVLLDANARADGHDYYDNRSIRVSPDQSRLAWAEDTTGGEIYTIYVKDLATGELLGEPIAETSGDLDWAADSETLFFTTLDDAHRPSKLKRRRVDGEGGVVELYTENDDRFHLEIELSRSHEYLILKMSSPLTSEVRVLDADQPEGRFELMAPRHENVQYFVEHAGSRFAILTNEPKAGEHARNFRLMQAEEDSRSRNEWSEVLPARPDVSLEGLDSFAGHMVLWEREDGLGHIRVISEDGETDFRAELPEEVYAVWPDRNPDFEADDFRFSYSSLLRPQTTYSMDMNSGEIKQLKVENVGEEYDPERYLTERHYALSEDGTRVPFSIIYRAGTAQSGGNPLVLEGYGAYGMSYDAWFSLTRLSLLDRGVIFAIAHVRGGGEMGKAWHEEGRLENKQNTFNDFVAVAEGLIFDRWTSPELLAIRGGSAGGLLIGAVVNQRPDLFHVAVAEVPFVDVLTTMLDESIPLTANEWEEWGDPRNPEAYQNMMAWSPYDNVSPQDYPHMLITAGLHDPRVQYWEPAKWTARLRTTKTDGNQLLLKTTMEGGHFGQSGRYGWLEDEAFVMAFMLDHLGWEGN